MNALHKSLAKAPIFEEIDNSQDARLGLIHKAVHTVTPLASVAMHCFVTALLFFQEWYRDDIRVPVNIITLKKLVR